MTKTRRDAHTFINLDFISIAMLWVSLFLLTVVVIEGSLAPLTLYIFMIIIGILSIAFFSNKDEIFFKIKLFIFFFSLYLTYTLIYHYIIISFFPDTLPYVYPDEEKFYYFSNLGLPYISGEKNIFELFYSWKLGVYELPLHVIFSSLITYFSTFIDGNNTIIIQKILSPFFGGMFTIVLYSTLKYQFKDFNFALNATFAYALLSVVFMYSTPLLRDIDVTLAYMIFIYLFLQKNSFINFLLLLVVAYTTVYLRVESGMVLFGLTLLYAHLYVIKLQSKSIKLIFYILLMVLSSFVFLLMYNKIIGMILGLDEGNTVRSMAQASKDSFGILLNKLPFGISHTAKVLFGQLQPFPFIKVLDRPLIAISVFFWPFVFIMMIFAVKSKNIRDKIDIKIKYLLIVAIVILFLMSSEAMARRMMSVYPIIYITSLYMFFIVPKNEIKRIYSYYIFGIIALNIFYYLIKL